QTGKQRVRDSPALRFCAFMSTRPCTGMSAKSERYRTTGIDLSGQRLANVAGGAEAIDGPLLARFQTLTASSTVATSGSVTDATINGANIQASLRVMSSSSSSGARSAGGGMSVAITSWRVRIGRSPFAGERLGEG